MDHFPLNLAQGGAFCNRATELKRLNHNIQLIKPTLVASPRRYGKTSLVVKAINSSKQPYAEFDFFSIISDEDVERIILKGVGKLITQLETGPKKALKLATDFFSGLSIKAVIDSIGLSIEIQQQRKKPSENILNILERLESLSKKYNKKLILFFDEFQKIGEISKDLSIESILRQVAQASENLIFIFSGSNRHLLDQMFNDNKRPFYNMCDRLILDRIKAKSYIPYIQKAAQNCWRGNLTKEAIEQIFFHTERHSYYLNLLCSKLWLNETLPTVNDVKNAWQICIEEDRSQIGNELDSLSKNQRKLLITLARTNGTKTPRGSEFLSISKMSSATIRQALLFLEKKDYVFKDSDGTFRVLNPMIKSIVLN